MNIFAVHTNPRLAAQMLCDSHVVKMPTECAQMLSTVAVTRFGIEAPYRPTHTNHPCNTWVAESRENAAWTLLHGLALCDEYYARYGRRKRHVHAARASLEYLWHFLLPAMPSHKLTPFAQCMPEAYRGHDAVAAYRRFYRGDKAAFAKWANGRSPPDWWTC